MTVFNNQHTKILEILIIDSWKPVRTNSNTQLNKVYIFSSLGFLNITKMMPSMQGRKGGQNNTVKKLAAINELEFGRNLEERKGHKIVLIIQYINEESGQNRNGKEKDHSYR